MLSLLLLSFFAVAKPAPGFVDITDLDSSILVEARYFTKWNFIGRPINGYAGNKCFLAKEAAEALVKVQKELSAKGYSLLAFDCYRPQRAVDDFVQWTKNPADQKMKPVYYVEEPKETLIVRGYIASKSGHSRGGTIDLTIVDMNKLAGSRRTAGRLRFQEENKDCRFQKKISATAQVDMGTTYDCFSERAATASTKVSAQAQANRQILKAAMEKFGFKNYSKEWWHFTLEKEPFPNDYFDFVVE